MNIHVLETDPREISLILKTLSARGDTLTPLSSSEEAWQAVKAGGARFLIVNLDTTDAGPSGLIPLIRSRQPAGPVYILIITERFEKGAFPGVDDTLPRPYRTTDLLNRIAIAERVITLTSSLQSAREQLETQAAFDPLTGFLNRAGFLRQAAGELERSRRASLPLSLIALDIDNFKTINDKFGTDIGDDVLRAVASAIREKSRPYDCIGRWTGDEFSLALPGVIGADAEKVSARVMAGVRGARIEVPNEPPLNVRISAGIASIMRITSTAEVEPIIQQARQALTRAKEAGGNQAFIVFL